MHSDPNDMDTSFLSSVLRECIGKWSVCMSVDIISKILLWRLQQDSRQLDDSLIAAVETLLYDSSSFAFIPLVPLLSDLERKAAGPIQKTKLRLLAQSIQHR